MGYTLGYHEASTGVHAYIHTGREIERKKKERQPTAVVVSCCVESAPKKYGRFPPSLLIRLECFFFPKIKNKKPTPPPAGYHHLLSPSFPKKKSIVERPGSADHAVASLSTIGSEFDAVLVQDSDEEEGLVDAQN